MYGHADWVNHGCFKSMLPTGSCTDQDRVVSIIQACCVWWPVQYCQALRLVIINVVLLHAVCWCCMVLMTLTRVESFC